VVHVFVGFVEIVVDRFRTYRGCRFFFRKMLGTRYGPVGSRFLWF